MAAFASMQHLNLASWIAIGVIFVTLAGFAAVGILIGRKNAKREIRIDLDRALAEFHNFAFITSFSSNRTSECIEVLFAEILGTKIVSGRNYVALELRTTKGKVMISDNIQPFDRLVRILSDAVELNRTSPESYKNALAQEPVVRTPWYGWAIIVATLVVAGYVFYRVMHS
ncbi:MAG TPA: hypothetical protein VNW30_01690 [Opitutaceae bacterium]|jgi:hypothetical protein|nr:hypothetical protein [Opitutaceae bacterium]